MIALLAALAVAVAQEAPADVPATEVPVATAPVEPLAPPAEDAGVEIREFEEDGHVVHEIIVYGDLRVEAARREVIHQLQQQGYTDVKDMGDYLRLRNDQVWKGEVRVYDDGWVHMKRQPVRFVAIETPWAEEGSPGAWLGCLVYPYLCFKPGGQLLSRNKMEGIKGRTLGAIDPEVDAFSDAVADRETEAVVQGLPDRLEALWLDGVPLAAGDLPLASPEDRKAALLDYWESRTDTPWGDRVRLAVEAYVRAEVQGSEHPFTVAEIEEFNARRRCERKLDLDSPWEVVSADVDTSW